MHYIIYKTTNKIDGKIYIGKHKTKDLSDNYMGSGKRINLAIKKHGLENFKKEILFVFDNEEDMNAKEAELVTKEFVEEDTNYNLCPGGNGGFGYINSTGLNLRTGMVHSEESRKKMGHLGNTFNKGKKHSDVTKEKLSKVMSEKLKGKEKSEEHKRKIAESVKQRMQEKKQAGIV
jgi:group I intron endonuclease